MGRAGRPAVAYFAVVLVLVLAIPVLPVEVRWTTVECATALLAAAAVLLGIRIHQPPSPSHWYHLTLGLVGLAMSTFVTGLARLGLYSDDRPSVADAITLIAYLCFITGVLGLLRDRIVGNWRAGLLDALLGATAASMIAWTYLVRPTVEVTDASLGVVMTASAYAVASVVLLAVAAPLWFSVSGRIDVSARILVLAMLVLVAANVAYGFTVLADLPPPTPGVQASIHLGWLVFFVLIGFAAMHPSMGSPPPRPSDTEVTPPSWTRFAALIVFAGLTPLAIVVNNVSQGDSLDLPTLIIGDVVMIAVVIVRMSDIQADLRGALRRERILRSANDELVSAVSVGEVREVLVETARTLLPTTGCRVWLVEDPRVAGFQVPEGAAGEVHVLTGPSDLRSTLSIEDTELLVVAELPTTTGTALAVVVACEARPRREVLSSLDALVQCAALAIDRVDLGQLVLARQSEARLQRLLQDASDVVAVLDRRMVVRYVTPAVERMLGRHPREVVGSRWLDHVRDDDREGAEAMIRRSNEGWPARGEVRLTTRDGGLRFVEVAVSRVAETDGGGYTLAAHDITDRHDLEQQLTHQAFHDALTGLANRALFQNRLRHVVDRARRTGEQFAVLFIDIDDFKTVNDSLGHAAGDTLLRTFATRLEHALRKQDTAARLGGDEFAVIVEDVFDEAQLGEATTRLIEQLSLPVQIGGTEVPIGTSIGVALGGSSDDDPEELMRNADLALYDAKASGKGRAAVYATEMHETVVDHLQLKADMRRGLNQGEFAVEYQPLFTLDDDAEIVGVEALVRWNHPTRGTLSPSTFVGLAEETGLVVPLGRLVLHRALADAAAWHQLPGHERLVIAVNLSGRQLIDGGVLDDVHEALALSRIDPSTVVLEITESVLLPDGGVTLERLQQLVDLGVRLYIDDFGTGYSSLAYLRDLPVAGIKLAREFVEVLPGTPSQSGLVRTIHHLARTLGLEQVVAEGIETEEQRQALIDLGYTVGQGFALARPTDEAGIGALLAGKTADRTVTEGVTEYVAEDLAVTDESAGVSARV